MEAEGQATSVLCVSFVMPEFSRVQRGLLDACAGFARLAKVSRIGNGIQRIHPNMHCQAAEALFSEIFLVSKREELFSEDFCVVYNTYIYSHDVTSELPSSYKF
jgi:hypothetical protein